MKNKIKNALLFLSLLILAFGNSAFAQDGEALFKTKCGACHIMGKDGTGPNLQGVKAKWEGEEEFLYEWVQNSPKVIAEGKSQRAQEVKDYSPTSMTPQDVTIEEAKAIIDFTDSWTPPAPKAETVKGESGEVVFVPDYRKNLTLLYVLIAVIAFLLLSILIVSKSTSALIRSDLFKQKIAEIQKKGNSGKMSTLLMILFVGVSTQAAAFSTTIPQLAENKNLWLYVENTDLYVLLIIALLLLGFLMHMVRMFYGVLKVMKPEAETEAEAIKNRISIRRKRRRNLSRALTGATPIEEEHKIDLGHDYDGIRELDNPMPPWWLAGFFISIVFSVVYLFHYHVLGTGDLQEVEYEKVMAREDAKVKEYLKAQAMDVDETNATLMTERADLRSGKSLFLNNCAVCHTENGSGEVGPNLTDEYWVYGGDIKDVFKVIRKGTPNGMPEHQSKFNPIQIQQVASYILTLDKISEERGGKEPEGELYLPEGEEEIKTDEKLDDVQREDMKDEELLKEVLD